MRIEALALFLSVVQCRSISRAARQNYISQQGASSAIRSLEQEFGTPLFDRVPGGLQLTDTGRMFAREAAEVMRAYRRLQMVAALGGEEYDDCPLSVVTMPFITNRLGEVFSESGQLAAGARLRIVERSLFDIVDSYSSDEPHVLYLVAIPAFMERIAARVADDFRPLVSCELMAVCGWNNPLAAREAVSRSELCNVPLACYNEEYLNRLMKHLFCGLLPDIRLRTSNIDLIERAVEHDGMATFTDSLSAFLQRPAAEATVVPIVDGISFQVGVLGVVEKGSASERFIRFFERYLATSCAPYMEHYACGEDQPPALPAAAASAAPASAASSAASPASFDGLASDSQEVDR